jgi:hypothetical protein
MLIAEGSSRPSSRLVRRRWPTRLVRVQRDFELSARLADSRPVADQLGVAIGTMIGVAVLINGITRVVISTAVHHEARTMTPKAA